ncbi:MAG: NADP-dependent oxidoreductase domain protein [Gemmatimonadetes bacterium]|nr:NADP-dependent oxidoreductase domain protein [Gemmatimonadota bacterium]
MSRRAREPHQAHQPADLTPPPAPPAGRAAQKASTVGTLRYFARAAARAEDFQRRFPRKLTVSALGIGTYLGDCTDAEDDRYRASVHEAITSGMNVIDTASNYRCQRSERAVGQAVDEAIASGDVRRDELLICTKGGYAALDGEPPASRDAYQAWLEATFFAPGIILPEQLVRGGHSLAPRFLAHQLDQSLANLGLQTIDIYYLHNPEEQLLSVDRDAFRVLMRDAFALLEERSAAGDIAGYGCATWMGFRVPPEHRQHLTLAELIAIAREVGGTAHHFRAVQLPVNLSMPEAARLATQPLGGKLVPFLEAADALGVGVVASAPIMQGRLAENLPDAVRELFPECTTDAQRALRFTSSLPGIHTVLAGMRSTAHVRENLAAWATE